MKLGDRLRRYLRAHGDAATDTYGYLARRTLGSLLVWLMIGLSLALPSGLYLLAVNLARVETDWSAKPSLSVYLKVGMSAAEVSNASALVREAPGVARVVDVPPEQALGELRRQLALEDDLSLLGGNPLPHSLRVALRADADIVTVERALGRLEGVDQVVSERLWRERFSALTGLVVQMGWLLGTMLALTSSVVAGAAVRLAIDHRLEEIQVLRLFGATDAQIRRPFLYLGLWYGIGGGLVGALAVSVGLGFVEQALTPLSRSYGFDLAIAGFDVRLLVGLIGGGAALGVLGAAVSALVRTRRIQFV